MADNVEGKSDNKEVSLVSLQAQPELARRFGAQKERLWPPFMFEDRTANRLWHVLGDLFPDYQLYLLDAAGEPVAVLQSAPLQWSGKVEELPIGWAHSLELVAEGHAKGIGPNTLVALEISISPEAQGQGVSYKMLQAAQALGRGHGFGAVIVAVRPTQKQAYPLVPMQRYMWWERDDGLPEDPWLRAHVRAGGEIVRLAHPSMVVEGTVTQWEEWTGQSFPESGDYLVKGALAPVHIDRRADLGLYVEPNVWVVHRL